MSVVRSAKIPVIGVGESTTTAVPRFLHDMLGLDRGEFFREVRPSWKLGIRFEWGDPRDSHFNYTFDPCMEVQLAPLGKLNAYHCLLDFRAGSHYGALMDRGLAPVIRRDDGMVLVDEGAGYHIENKAFVAYLEEKVRQSGVPIVSGDVVDVKLAEDGSVASLLCEDGRQLDGDLFVDCTGFRSLLLGQTLEEPWLSYDDALFADAAVVGSWSRSTDEPLLPYTTAETMDHGWCWRIEFPQHITRGYVFSSAFCSTEQAMSEMKAKNPRLGNDLRLIRFPTGRRNRFWVKNVAAVGNSAGFVEPLEATALHLMIEQIRLLRLGLADGDRQINSALQRILNQRYAELWDDTRNFLAVHYKFNRRLETPFWQHCRQATALHEAESLVELYRAAGPSTMCDALIPPKTIFGFNGYLSMLIGQRVPTDYRFQPSVEETRRWESYRHRIRQQVQRSLPMQVAWELVADPSFVWTRRGM